MSKILELQQVICPSCKQVISSFSPFVAQVECPYCHNKAFNPLITAKKVPIPERIILFKTTEKDFEHALVKDLVENDYVPTDIFESINPENVIKAYLPMFLYEGTYESSWACSVARTKEVLRANSKGNKFENETVTSYIPYSGTSYGNFSFLCLAYDGNDIPAELSSFCSHLSYNASESQEFDSSLLGLDSDDSPITIALNADSETVWSKHGKENVESLARRTAQEQLISEDFCDFHASCSYKLERSGRYVLAPFWFVYYKYNNEKHYYVMDGLGLGKARSLPQDKDEINYINEMKKSRKKKLWRIRPLYIIIFLLCIFIDNVVLGISIDEQESVGPFSLIGFLILNGGFVKDFLDYVKIGKELSNRMSYTRELRQNAAKKRGYLRV